MLKSDSERKAVVTPGVQQTIRGHQLKRRCSSPCQVLGNKKDLPGALTERELIERMDLQTLAQVCPREPFRPS